jgi:hypothetical protein
MQSQGLAEHHHNDFHPLLHPDIFALIAIKLGECIGGPDFCAWLSTCKRAQRLSTRTDVTKLLDLLSRAYDIEYVVKISQQRILPYDLVCRMININPMNLFDLPRCRRTFPLCELAFHGMQSTLIRLRLETDLTEDQIFALWKRAIARDPGWIQEAEQIWDGSRLDELVTIGSMVDKTFTIMHPASPFVCMTTLLWNQKRRTREKWRRFRDGCMYGMIGGSIGCAFAWYLGGDLAACVVGSITTTLLVASVRYNRNI